MKPGLINEDKKKIPELNSIKITKEAFQKMNLYASIVSEINGNDIECLGALLNYKNRNDNTVRDIYLFDQQNVTHSAGRAEEDDTEIKKNGLSVIGFWHSHGYNGVFHSSRDEEYLKLKYNFGCFKNKIVTGERRKNIECIVDGETVRLFEEGSNKEIRIKGKIEDINYVELDEYDVLNNIVINRNSYSGGFVNPGLNQDYDAEVWAGYDKKTVKECWGYDDKRCPEYGKKKHDSKEYKRLKHVPLELVDETNNIQLDEEELVKEAGEKVRLDGGHYLKDLPGYQKVLEKYKSVKNAKNAEHIEEIIKHEGIREEPSLTGIIQKQEEPAKQGVEHDQALRKTKTYMERLEEIYDSLSSHDNSADKMLAELCKAYSGKEEWFWTKRYEKGNEILGKLKKKNLTLEHKNTLENIKGVVESNKYLKRNYPTISKDILRKLEQKETPETKFYTKDKIRKALTIAALSAGIAVLTAALTLIPEQYRPKEERVYEKPAIVYTVKKGDTLWGLTKNYLKGKGIVIDNTQLYKAVDKIAEENGKGKQAEYSTAGKEKKNPHYIKPGQKIKLSEKILKYIKKGGKK